MGVDVYMMRIAGISPFDSSTISLDIDSSVIFAKQVTQGNCEGVPFLSPGFFDIQVNGFLGMDYSSAELQAEHIGAMVRAIASTGTTRHLPTITTSPQDRILRNIEIIRETREKDSLIANAIPGIHIEGPYINRNDGPRGTHDIAFVRNPNINEFKEWQDAANGMIKIITIAPETEGAIDFIEEVASSGVIVSIGHTAAKPEEIRQAVQAGARLSTHLGNGSPTLIPRLKNHIWPQLACDALTSSIISDGDHLPAEVVLSYARVKGLQRTILVSDVAPLGGFPRGFYKWGDVEVEVFEDGHIGLPGTEILSGAAHMLDWDIPHFMRFTNTPLGPSIGLCTDNPDLLLGIPGKSTQLLVGTTANLVVFDYDPSEPKFRILKTIIAGQIVYSRE